MGLIKKFFFRACWYVWNFVWKNSIFLPGGGGGVEPKKLTKIKITWKNLKCILYVSKHSASFSTLRKKTYLVAPHPFATIRFFYDVDYDVVVDAVDVVDVDVDVVVDVVDFVDVGVVVVDDINYDVVVQNTCFNTFAYSIISEHSKDIMYLFWETKLHFTLILLLVFDRRILDNIKFWHFMWREREIDSKSEIIFFNVKSF